MGGDPEERAMGREKTKIEWEEMGGWGGEETGGGGEELGGIPGGAIHPDLSSPSSPLIILLSLYLTGFNFLSIFQQL
jgi:hypothetical protein